MAHRRKNKDDENLVFIERIDEGDSSLTIAAKVISMYEDDFNLTISEIASFLKCERQWVTKYVQKNVKHIFLNEQYRRFLYNINKTNHLIEEELVLKDYYYFSRKDFYRWLKENTVVTRQTIKIDLGNYCNDIQKFKDINGSSKEDIFEGLNQTGKNFFVKVVDETHRDAKPITLYDKELPEEFVSIKELKSNIGKSLEIVYRNLYSAGAIKYTINNSLVRYDSNYLNPNIDMCYDADASIIVTIPYETYLKNRKA